VGDKNKRAGFSLIELIVVIAIMAVLVAILAPQFIKYVEKSKQAKVEKEASEFDTAARAAIIDCGMTLPLTGNNIFTVNTVSKITNNGEIFEVGTKCGRITNFWFVKKNGKTNLEINANNTTKYPTYPFVKGVADTLGESDSKSLSIPMSSVTPGTKDAKLPSASAEKKNAIFQILFTWDGDIVTEYYREGYYVHVESGVVASMKVANGADLNSTFTYAQNN